MASSDSSSKNAMCGVVDIGSNAIRMLIGQVTESGNIKKVMKHREPIRLGHDVFVEGSISKNNLKRTAEAFEKFNRDFDRFGVEKIRVVATSAVREASNQKQFLDAVLGDSGLAVEIIEFKEEADLIVQAAMNTLDLYDKHFMLMDIGGGSVEFVVGTHRQNHVISLPLGTVRLLELTRKSNSCRMELENKIDEFSAQIKQLIQEYPDAITHFIGTGGNMECLGYLRRLLFRKESRFKVRYHELDYIVEELFRLNSFSRMKKFELREDRADVILPASLLSQFVLSQLELDRILLPGVGLREGVLLSLK